MQIMKSLLKPFVLTMILGAFAVALTEGLSTVEAAAWGNAAGALAVTRPGAQPSLPDKAELNEFLSRLE